MVTHFVRSLSALLLACLPAVASAQTSRSPEPTYPVDAILPPRGTTHQPGAYLPAEAIPPSCDPGADSPFFQGIEFHPRAEATQLLHFGDRGLGVTEVEAKLGIDIPFLSEEAPFKIAPGAAGRWFDGPSSPFASNRPDLPSQMSDFYVDFSWRPRPAKWLFIDMKVTPGFYSDLRNTSSDAFRLRGHGAAIVALSEKFQIVLGAAYVNRYNYKVVPIGGIRWLPNEDTEFRLVVPAPRISHRIANFGDTKIKLYLSGEYGGGFWAVRRDNGQDDVVDYSDFRLLSGVEAELPGDRRWYAEIGYVFRRRIDYVSTIPPTFQPTDTLLFRIGFIY